MQTIPESSPTPTTVEETLFDNGTDFFSYLLHDIQYAKISIDLETYTFNKHHIGTKIGEALIEASQRGVRVRLLVDGAGTPRWGGRFTKRLEKSGIKTRIFHPLPWGLWQWSRSMVRLPSVIKIIYLLLKINTRNHRKTCIIDKKIAYIGSLNIDYCHLKQEQGGKGWRDTAVRLQKIDLRPLQQAFEAAWSYVPFSKQLKRIFHPTYQHNSPIRLNSSHHARRLLYKNLLRRIAKSKQRIWIINAYFIPNNFLLKKLKDAARKGVDVRILLPYKSDHLIMPWASASFYEKLLKAKVRIFEYQPNILHAKVIMLDNWFMLGSSNLNHRSLLHDLEVDVVIQSPQSKQQLEEHFHRDLEYAKEVYLSNCQARPWYQRLLGYLLLYMKYWI